jgi:hypothetical protein
MGECEFARKDKHNYTKQTFCKADVPAANSHTLPPRKVAFAGQGELYKMNTFCLIGCIM